MSLRELDVLRITIVESEELVVEILQNNNLSGFAGDVISVDLPMLKLDFKNDMITNK